MKRVLQRNNRPKTTFEYLICCCLTLIFVGFPVIVGIISIQYIINSPFPAEPSEYLSIIAPFAFAGFVALLFIGLATGKLGQLSVPPSRIEYSEVIHEAGDSTSVIDISTECSTCGAPLAMEDVEWVGPMQFKCPNCGSVHRATRREI